jgi:hypothetical protein
MLEESNFKINWDEIQKKLSAPFPAESVQKTKKEISRKAYDTTGIGYQFIVNRFNDVLGNSWGYEYTVLETREGKFTSGKPYFDITVKTTIWCLSPDNGRTLVGGHISSIYADALKGAITNSFKKTAAMWGVGREAYEGTLDDDAKYEDDVTDDDKKKEVDTKEKPKATPKPSGGVTRDGKTPDKGDLQKKTEPVKQEQKEEPKKEQQELPIEETKTNETTKGALGADGRVYLGFDDLKKKMATSKNMFELNARCKKYKPDYDQFDKEQQVFVRVERDKRKMWLTRGEGNYSDTETKGINKDYKEKEKK